MNDRKRIVAIAVAATAAIGISSAAYAKAHDQGKADGTLVFPDAQNAKQQIDFLTNLGVLDGRGVSQVQRDGKRGDISSTAKGDVRVIPVVNNK